MTRFLAGSCLLAALLLGGCKSRLNVDKTISLEAGPQLFTIDAISSEQKVKVSVEAEEAPVDVFVFLEKDQTAAESALFNTSKDEPFLGRKLKEKSVALEVTVPANEAATVMIQATVKAPKTVKVKISN